MRKTLIILTVALLCFETLFAQISQRRIYLWDVTLSMKGKTYPNGKLFYDAEKNIYNDVRDFLINEINSKDENTEIVVLPFQEESKLPFIPWIVQANETGRNEIIRKIRNFSNNAPSNTDIVGAIEYAKKNLVEKGKDNTLVLLTDGTQSKDLSGGNKALIQLIKDWKQYAKVNDAYLLYIMLNDKAIPDDKSLLNTLKEEEKSRTMSVVTDFIILEPSVNNFSLKDDKGKPVVINFESKNNANPNLPSKMKARVYSTKNPYVNIDNPFEIKDLKVAFRLNDEETARTKMLEDKITEYTVTLHIDLLNQEEIQRDGKTVTISPNEIKLVLINKPVKTLKISYEK